MTWRARYFTLAELTHSDTAVRLGLDNTPPPEALANLEETAVQMDRIRGILGHPITVNSGYRGAALNKRVGGSPKSAHSLGYAVDFVCPGYVSPLEICRVLQHEDIAFDQLIWEFRSWVHISFDPRMRGQVLTATKEGGRTVYLPGLKV